MNHYRDDPTLLLHKVHPPKPVSHPPWCGWHLHTVWHTLGEIQRPSAAKLAGCDSDEVMSGESKMSYEICWVRGKGG
jgi:hypothetical protein